MLTFFANHFPLGITSINHRFFGDFGIYTFRYKPPFLERSSDCGETWESINDLTVASALNGMSNDGNKIYTFPYYEGEFYYSDDNSNTWKTIYFPGAYTLKIIPQNDSLWIQNYDKTYRSYDGGQNWDVFPTEFRVTRLWKYHNQFIAVDEDETFPYESRMFVSYDFCESWQPSFSTDLLFLENAQVGSAKINFPLGVDGLIFLQANRGLYMTYDIGAHWTKIGDLPFTIDDSGADAFGTYIDTISEGARVYYYDDGFLYAGTHTQGIWRTPFAPLLEHAQGVVPSTEILHQNNLYFSLSPNPFDKEIIVRLEIQLPENHTALLRIYNPQGQLVQLENVDTALQPIRTDQLPPGFYVAELILDGQRQVIKTVKL